MSCTCYSYQRWSTHTATGWWIFCWHIVSLCLQINFFVSWKFIRHSHWHEKHPAKLVQRVAHITTMLPLEFGGMFFWDRCTPSRFLSQIVAKQYECGKCSKINYIYEWLRFRSSITRAYCYYSDEMIDVSNVANALRTNKIDFPNTGVKIIVYMLIWSARNRTII